MKTEQQLRQQYHQLLPSLDERGRREWAASEAMTLGYGGIALVHRASGLSRTTITRGIGELREAQEHDTASRQGRHERATARAPLRRRPPEKERGESAACSVTLEALVESGHSRGPRVAASLDAQVACACSPPSSAAQGLRHQLPHGGSAA